ncbi:hypothetical protein C8Q79DRAFT_456622 [Trametes meyenii]|nr:hypothetical protein C8Q79DRAFT_456622 [Trametes meyenii]
MLFTQSVSDAITQYHPLRVPRLHRPAPRQLIDRPGSSNQDRHRYLSLRVPGYVPTTPASLPSACLPPMCTVNSTFDLERVHPLQLHPPPSHTRSSRDSIRPPRADPCPNRSGAP